MPFKFTVKMVLQGPLPSKLSPFTSGGLQDPCLGWTGPSNSDKDGGQ